MYVGDSPGLDQTYCGSDEVRGDKGGDISAVGCKCPTLGSIVTVNLRTTSIYPVITRIAVFGLPKKGAHPNKIPSNLNPIEFPKSNSSFDCFY